MSSLAFFLMVLYISAFSIRCLLSLFSAISRRFFIRVRVSDDIIDFCDLIISLAILDVLKSAMVSLVVSMSSNYCSVSNRFLNLSWNSIFVDPVRVASTLGGLLVFNCFLSTSTSSLMLLTTSLWSLPMLTWLMTATSVTMSGLFVRI